MNKLLKSLVCVCSLGMASAAYAAPVTDVLSWIPTGGFSSLDNAAADGVGTYVHIGASGQDLFGDYLVDTFTYQHSLVDEGVPTDFLVESATLSVWVADDIHSMWENDSSEMVEFSFSGFTSNAVEVDGNIYFYELHNFALGVSAIASINDDGIFDVTVKAKTGDFYVKKSKLVAELTPVEVSEPGSLAILGLGLASLGWIRRRKTA